jgi:thiosulfate reductase cytochrome b subunit
MGFFLKNANLYQLMKRIVKKHPLAIRWFHWINFPLITIMVWSGFLIYWANDIYRIGWGNTTILKFFPQSFYDALHLEYKLASGMAFHFVFMWLFAINGLLYVLYSLFSGEWRYLWPDRHSLKDAWLVLLHDLHLRKSAPPQDKYNGAQKITYSAIILMGLGSVLSGLAIYKPIQFGWLCASFGGYETARIVHFTLTIGYCLFFLVHVLQVIRAGWKNFRSMVAGFDVELINPINEQEEITIEDKAAE